jgi:nucleobase:cation symporter-1, NCS1 family
VLPPIAGLSRAGPVPAHLTSEVDCSWVVGLVVSGLGYWILSRSLDRSAEQAAIEASDRQLEALAK